jgi:signal transduction histidine kinase
MTRLINDLVDISSLEPGRLEIRPGWLDIADTVQEVAESLQRDADARQHALTLDAPDTLIVWADQNRVRQILTNLVTNAIKYTPEGGTVSITVEPGEEMVEISVADSGIGIKPDEQMLLFERFYRAPGGRRMSHGAGLGLPIARALVELHGGTLRSESDGADGSTFVFTLPRKPLGSD